MFEGIPKDTEVFTDAEKERMLKDARKNEAHHRAMTDGEATEDTQKVFEAQETEQAIKDADPDTPLQYELDEKNQSVTEKERAQRAIEKIRAMLRAKEPERPDYDHPPVKK